jgi:hypothetical protein
MKYFVKLNEAILQAYGNKTLAKRKATYLKRKKQGILTVEDENGEECYRQATNVGKRAKNS